MNYYNDNEKYCAQWLRNLIADGHIPNGHVDERPIQEVTGGDLAGYTQCHFFAGIGGWPLALRMAGWPEDGPVWTGSCPCQPFSVAGKRRGVADERHLWPEFQRLIAERHPPVVFGEQVASKDGRVWLSGVRVNLEALGYAVGVADLCAAGIGAPHIRQRLYWVAEPGSAFGKWREDQRGPAFQGEAERDQEATHNQRMRAIGGMGHADETGPQRRGIAAGQCGDQLPIREAGEFSGMGIAYRNGLPQGWQASPPAGYRDTPVTTGCQSGFWSDFDILPCLDGKARRVESGTFPLAHGVPARMGKLRAYGNAIVPQVAAEFIRAHMDARGL